MTSHKRARAKGKKPQQNNGNKLATLPKDAQIKKRPLMRPPIVSRYANADQQKVVYISTKTPFLSAVKRVEKLLRLADKRLIQSATTIAKTNPHQRGKRPRLTFGAEAVDEIAEIARTADQLKDERPAEEVYVKGTGKAIPKVMDLGVWFQKREEYKVKIHTGTVSGIDDVEYEQKAPEVGVEKKDTEDMEIDGSKNNPDYSRVVKHEETKITDESVAVSETRIRKMSMLELRISLR